MIGLHYLPDRSAASTSTPEVPNFRLQLGQEMLRPNNALRDSRKLGVDHPHDQVEQSAKGLPRFDIQRAEHRHSH
jgi:hypothetical protein